MKDKVTQPKNGLDIVHNERLRQITEKRFDTRHDAAHREGELAQAGAAYAMLAGAQSASPSVRDWRACQQPTRWPWPGRLWKPSNNRIDNLKRAAALLVAEIDRLMTEGYKDESEVEAEVAK